jgi:hypothetical protein
MLDSGFFLDAKAAYFTRSIETSTYLLPPSVQEWLPEGTWRATWLRWWKDWIYRALERAYAGRGSAPYHPATLLALLIYGYATGCYSSRKIERATYDSWRFATSPATAIPTTTPWPPSGGASTRSLRRFVQVLQVARENQLSRFGTVSLDGTKIHANASRHSALSYGHAEAIEAQLKARSKAAGVGRGRRRSNVPDGMSLPDEIKRREDRSPAIAAAKAKIEARAAERYAREQAEYEAKLAARAAKAAAATGKKPAARHPRPPPRPAPERPDQPHRRSNPASCRSPVAASSSATTPKRWSIPRPMLVLVPQVTQAANDKQQVVPMLEQLQALPAGSTNPSSCWPIPATSARPTWPPARQPASSR